MQATNFDIRITKELAEYLLQHDALNPRTEIMCKEYGMYTDQEGDDWTAVYPDDLNEEGKLAEGYKTFELWTA